MGVEVKKTMAWQLNQKGYQHARELIEADKITEDQWEPPRLEDFNGNIEEYALYHLAKDPNGDPENAGTYAYPYGKNGKVYIRALRAIRAAAAGARGATPNREIYEAAGRLLDMLSEQSNKSVAQDNMILKIDKQQHIVTAPALVPGEEDSDGDIVTEEQIEAVAYKFLTDYQNVDVMHTFRKVARPVESWILREPMTIKQVELPKGTWLLSVKVEDDQVWDKIVKGEYNGFSVTAVPAVTKSAIFRKKTLAEIGWPWDVVTVSIVDRPAVPKAKFISVKRDDDEFILYKIFKILEEKFRGDTVTNDSPEEQAPQDDGLNDLTERIMGLQAEIETIKNDIETMKADIEDLRATITDMTKNDNNNDTGTNDGKAQTFKGQVGTIKRSYDDLYKEMGVDRFGRPLKKA